MSTADNDQQLDLLKSIASSLKGIHSSLESLTAAVEDVSETIEKAHEPEGDLGVHLVGALKDLVGALHKRAQQERNFQPQQSQPRHQQNQPRRDQQRYRQDDQRAGGTPPEDPENTPLGEDSGEDLPHDTEFQGDEMTSPSPVTEEKEGAPSPNNGARRRRPRGRRPGTDSPK